jgi:hypothetical protein
VSNQTSRIFGTDEHVQFLLVEGPDRSEQRPQSYIAVKMSLELLCGLVKVGASLARNYCVESVNISRLLVRELFWQGQRIASLPLLELRSSLSQEWLLFV